MTRTEEVVEAIKQMILAGQLRSGDRLPVEKDLAAELGLSRGSLREGVRALTAIGVLATRQGDGTYVTSLEPSLLFAPLTFAADLGGSDSLQFLHVRRVLESEAAAQAATRISASQLELADTVLEGAELELSQGGVPDHERLLEADRAFHRVISTAAGNPVLTALLEVLSGRTWRARLWRSQAVEGITARTLAEHRAILDALRSRDPDRARLRMDVHILGVEEFVRSRLDGPGPS